MPKSLDKKTKRIQCNITKAERGAFNSLQSNDAVTIMKADKGSGTVILNTADYDNEAERQLNNSLHYKINLLATLPINTKIKLTYF